MKIHFIQQDPWVTPGEYLSWAIRRSLDISYTRCWEFEEIPHDITADILVILGGYQSPATTKDECAYYDSPAEQELIRKYVQSGKAVIGVCLGAQLLGEALGAPYEHSPEKEIGPVKAVLTDAGRLDPFFAGFPDVFDAGEWHNDMPGLTPDAVIIAASEGCPRQIVRYGRFVYGFQTHMEFTREIISAGLADAGGSITASGRFVQSAKELMAYDYTEMNRMLSTFLDALLDEYMLISPASIPQLIEKMISFYNGSIHDIDHFLKVWAYAKTIGSAERLEPHMQYLLEAAAVVHDIACPLCREKYGNAGGKHQEFEGPGLVRDFLSDCGMTIDQIERIAFLVGHHHTLSGIDNTDWQILIEADYIVNASENACKPDAIRHFLAKHFRTDAGKRICRSVFNM